MYILYYIYIYIWHDKCPKLLAGFMKLLAFIPSCCACTGSKTMQHIAEKSSGFSRQCIV